MSGWLAVAALAVVGGSVVAVAAREARAAAVGLVVALSFGPFIADPLPGPAVLGARVISGILVAYLLRIVVGRGEVPGLGSRLGWPAEAVFAAVGVIAGLAMAGGLASVLPGSGVPDEAVGLDRIGVGGLALAAGLGLVVVGLGPAFAGRSALRAAVGLVVVAQGVVLVRTGLAGPPGDLEQLGIDGLLLTLGAAGAVVAWLERRDREARPRVGLPALPTLAAETGPGRSASPVSDVHATPTRSGSAEP